MLYHTAELDDKAQGSSPPQSVFGCPPRDLVYEKPSFQKLDVGCF